MLTRKERYAQWWIPDALCKMKWCESIWHTRLQIPYLQAQEQPSGTENMRAYQTGFQLTTDCETSDYANDLGELGYCPCNCLDATIQPKAASDGVSSLKSKLKHATQRIKCPTQNKISIPGFQLINSLGLLNHVYHRLHNAFSDRYWPQIGLDSGVYAGIIIVIVSSG